ncbi:universal stress protein [Nocardioides endophyticus]|uniref:Universal stress protein n=1 Tax=Nocardioides endophyticus TaxID=1353775 RepID=A0ABP8Z1P8_9ACTN
MTTSTDTSIPTDAIVVGIDGSACAELALDWAAREASLEHRPLVLLHAVHPPSLGAMAYVESSGMEYGDLLARLESDGHALLRHAAQRVRAEHDVSEVYERVRMSDPRTALLEAAAGASALVVGTRGLGPIRQLLLGSVAMAAVKHAGCPVAVIRGAEQKNRDVGVMVGVAGDGHDATVLDFAFRVADARGLPVTLVHTFWDAVGQAETREVPADDPRHANQLAVLFEAAGPPSRRYPSVAVHHLLSRGFADVQLIASSRRAALLVLGHRRKPFLQELIYGSVAPRVVEHAHCSVAVVPVGDEPDA